MPGNAGLGQRRALTLVAVDAVVGMSLIDSPRRPVRKSRRKKKKGHKGQPAHGATRLSRQVSQAHRGLKGQEGGGRKGRTRTDYENTGLTPEP